MNQFACLALINNITHVHAPIDGSEMLWAQGPVTGMVRAVTGDPVNTTIWFSTYQYNGFYGTTDDGRINVATTATEAKRQALWKLWSQLPPP